MLPFTALRFPSGLLAALSVLSLAASMASAQERRASPPEFSADEIRGVFFEDLSKAIRGQRPALASIRKSAEQPDLAETEADSTEVQDSGTGALWSSLISPTSLEDEVKRVRLHFDSLITTPGAFNSGGYLEARVDLSVLAMMFAVINEYGGDVRWKEHAAAARDLLARSAFNCKAGSNQVYNEAKLRRADLQDLVSGAGLSQRDAQPENDWSRIVDRSPLMDYADQLINALEDANRNEDSIQENLPAIKRNAELLAVLGEVLVREGMAEADDDDYAKLSRGMVSEAKQVVGAIERRDLQAISTGISGIRQRCDTCHNQYR